MKKFTTIFLYALLSISLLSSCSREAWDKDKTDAEEEDTRAEGQVGLAALKVSVDLNLAVGTRAVTDPKDFLIRIYDKDKGGILVQEWKYSEMPEIFTLKVSHYTIVAMSHEVEPAEFEKPYYFASEDFEIAENTVTDLQALVCSLQNIMVTVEYDNELKALLGDDAQVGVKVGNGQLVYTKDETRAGYFEAVSEGTNLLFADLKAKVDGEDIFVSKAFLDVKAGQHRVVKYSLKDNPGDGGDSGTGTVKLQIDVTCEVVEKDLVVDPGDEEVLPDDPEVPDNPDGEDKPTIKGDGFDIVGSLNPPVNASDENPYPVVVKFNVPKGIKNLLVNITTDAPDFEGAVVELKLDNFDLAYPGEAQGMVSSLGFPYGEQVINATELDFAITKFIPMLVGFPGTHKFNLTVTDNDGVSAKATLTVVCK